MSGTPESEQRQSLTELLESIVLEEMALAHFINAEAKKMESIIKMMKDENICFERVIDFLSSASRVMKTVINKQMLLQFKLDDILSFKEELKNVWIVPSALNRNIYEVKNMKDCKAKDFDYNKGTKDEEQNSSKKNIITNGNFELWQSPERPEFWQGMNIGVTKAAKTGITAVHLGSVKESKKDLPSNLWQKVKVEDKSVLELKFFVTSLLVDCRENQSCNPQIIVRLSWLDKFHNEIGEGINLFIPDKSLPACRWTFFDKLSSPPPQNAEFAILSFSAAVGKPIAIDNVSLIEE